MALLRTITIVGGGFSGTALASHLLEQTWRGPTRIVLIERDKAIGRGVAYVQRRHPFLLNVPASRMSATSKAPLEFLRFAERRIPDVQGDDFLPRALYGEYLEERLIAARLNAATNVCLEIWQGEVIDVRRIDRRLPLQVVLAGGSCIASDEVVLALGNPPPAPLAAACDVAEHPGYVADPHRVDISFSPHENVLLIGTGLTAADIVTVAAASPAGAPNICMLSRHGLIPPRQTAFRPDAFKGDGHALLFAAATSLRRLTRSVRLLAREAEQSGGDWREAITFVRNMAPTLWQRLSERDQRRFLRHLRTQWEIHRHRLPAVTLQQIERLRAERRLAIAAGRIQSMQPAGERIRVTWQVRGSQDSRSGVFDRVINCTGPDYAIVRSQEPLWRNLLRSGLCVPDTHNLGLRTGPNGAVVDADGWPGPHLFYLGPMLRATHWEATAVGELRGHAERLAQALATGST
ncbi:MAG TPA: FAD/NAD(P)-binding protein [Steroidobacteraceae bacterium]